VAREAKVGKIGVRAGDLQVMMLVTYDHEADEGDRNPGGQTWIIEKGSVVTFIVGKTEGKRLFPALHGTGQVSQAVDARSDSLL